MPLMAWIALCGLFVTVSVQGVAFAYFMGGLSNRIEVLERESKRDAAAAETVIRLDERLKTVAGQLEKLGREMAGIHRALASFTSGARSLAREFSVEG